MDGEEKYVGKSGYFQNLNMIRHKHAADVDGDEDDVGPPVITHTFKGMQRTHTHTLAERESERKQDGEVAMMVANCFRLMLSDVRMPGMKKHSSARERGRAKERGKLLRELL